MTIKVIGAGLARTGTMSLKMALEQLGYEDCFHMVELLKNPARLTYLDLSHQAGATDQLPYPRTTNTPPASTTIMNCWVKIPLPKLLWLTP